MSMAPLKHRTDAAQRQASDPTSSVWVAANAGSGKTHALTNRVARLLLAGTPPERILCLTFTRAAAAEMATRLFQRLGEWATLSTEDLSARIEDLEGSAPSQTHLAQARRLFARAIETPGGLKIQTIHAFCERILGRFPLEADIEPHFDVMDDRTGAELKRLAREQMMTEAAADPESALGQAFGLIVATKDEREIASFTEELLGKQGALLAFFDRNGSATRAAEHLRVHLGLAPNATSSAIEREMIAGIPDMPIRAAAIHLANGSKQDQDQRDRLLHFIEFQADRPAESFQVYRSVFFTDKGEPRKRLITKSTASSYPETAELMAAEQERLGTLEERLNMARVAELTTASLVLAERLIALYTDEKRARGQLDYDDLIRRTRTLLTQSTMSAWVLYKLDGGLDHILVDEAQDTSPDQWDIVRLLAEEFLSGEGARDLKRTLFAVGDEKQSIYSFQGAEPERFDAMRRYFEARVREAALAWHPVRLVRSFRSTPKVLALVDSVFADPLARDGLSATGELDEHIAVRDGAPGLVELWDLERPDEDRTEEAWDLPVDYIHAQSAVAKLATRIAETIAGWLEAGERSASHDRPIRPGDIAVLVRRRNAFANEVVRALKAKNIPVAGMDRMHLNDEIAAMDLIALGRFALLPEDDLTLATVLKSPFIGFDDDALFALAHGREGTLWAQLGARATSEPDGKEAEAFAWLGETRRRARHLRPVEFYADLLSARDGRRRLIARLGQEAIDPIEEFLSLAFTFEETHVPTLEGFLHWLEGGGAEIKRDLEQSRNEVRLITVHGAKGLEADIVFLGDTCGRTIVAQHDPAFLTSIDETDTAADAIERPASFLLHSPSPKQDDPRTAVAREAYRRGAEREHRRLLYVALTRARDRLYVTGHTNSLDRDVPDGCWYALVRQAFQAEQAVEESFADGLRRWRLGSAPAHPDPAAPGDAAPADRDEATERPSPPLPSWARRPAPHEPDPPRPMSPSRALLDPNAAPGLLSPLEGGRGAQKNRFKRGNLIHRLLQSLPDLAPADREHRARAFLALPGHDLAPEEQAEIHAAVFKVLNDPAFAALFVPEARAEVALAGEVRRGETPHAISARLDRLLVTENEVLVIDFKTNRPPPKTPAEVAPAYLMQMAAYRALLAQIYPGRQIRAGLLWTDGPTLMSLEGDRLDAIWSGS